MRRNPVFLVSFGFFGLLVLVILGYLAFGTPKGDVVAEGINLSGINISGMTEPEISAALWTYEDSLTGSLLTATFGGQEATLDPLSIDLQVDADAATAEALSVNADESFLNSFLTWLGLRSRDIEISIPISVNEDALDAQFLAWDMTLLTDETIGGIRLEGTTPVAMYAAPRTRIDRVNSREAILEALVTPEARSVALTTEVGPPIVTDEAVDEALAAAQALLAGNITLEDAITQSALTFTTQELASAFTAETVTGADPHIEISLRPETMDELLAPIREQLADTFRDARFKVDDQDQVSIIPGVSGPKVSTNVAITEILLAAQTPSRIGVLPLKNSADPNVTEADLAELGVEHLVSRFTTYHDCCENRVENIHNMADTVDGVIVMPGQEFSLNGFVGERTREKGYLPAGTIIKGEIVDTVGGGVSQFATTFYNAVFWGGYTDVTHKPHSFYFSRYPEGIEATINWPNLDMAFRNDTDHAVLIKINYTETSLTVKFFGDNAGQGVGGEQRNGTTATWVESEGDGFVITGEVSGRYNYTSASTQYVADESVTPGESQIKQGGGEGWSVVVTRTKTFPDGTTEIQEWVARYVAKPRILVVHPCSVPGSLKSCEDETSTTAAGTTTTTAPGITTSTTTTTVATVP